MLDQFLERSADEIERWETLECNEMKRQNDKNSPECCSPGDEESTLIQLSNAVMLHGVSIANWKSQRTLAIRKYFKVVVPLR